MGEKIRGRIISGQLPQGTVLREAELADCLGMSKIPVREAMVRLEREGMIALSRTAAPVFSK